jgi:hypothetical protein
MPIYTLHMNEYIFRSLSVQVLPCMLTSAED